MHSMLGMRGKTGFFVIKVDLAKAYDQLRWSCLMRLVSLIIFLILFWNVYLQSRLMFFVMVKEPPCLTLRGASDKEIQCRLTSLLCVWINYRI